MRPLLADQLHQSGKASLIAVLPEDASTAREFLHSNHIVVDQQVSMDIRALGVNGTPTIILVSTKGQVLHAWVGKLTPQREKKLLSTLS